MTYDIHIAAEAKTDLRSIYRYIAFELNSAKNASGQIKRLEKAIKSLNKMPERYRVYDQEPWKSQNLRILSVDKYLIFYIPNNDKRIVTIMRIMYGARDIDAQLNED